MSATMFEKNGISIDVQKRNDELRNKALELVRWLNENGHPHQTITITQTSIKLSSDDFGMTVDLAK